MKQRKSNIELLRIICFVMIVTLHISPIGLVAANPIEQGTFSYYFCILMRIFVNAALTTFVIIGGYVSFYGKFDLKKTLKRLFIPFLMFFPVFMYRTCVNYQINDIGKFFEYNIKDLLSFSGSYYHLWYIFVYLIILILFNYLREGLDKKSKKENFIFITILLLFSSVNTFYPSLNIRIFNDLFSNRLLFLTAVFCSGYYINKYDIKVSKPFAIGLIIINYIIFALLFKMVSNHEGSLYYIYLDNNNLFTGLLSISWLLLFKNIDIKNMIVNKIASLTYGAYICHVIFIEVFMKYINLYQYFNHKYYILIMSIFIILVIVCSFILEYVRKKIIKNIVKK